MVHYDSLNAHDRNVADTAMKRSHSRRVELVITDRNGDNPRSLTNRFLTGVITGEEDRTPRELLEAHVLDPDMILDYAHGRHRKFDAQVIDHRFIVALDEWVEKEVFTGPLWEFDRAGEEVTLVAQGSERKAMGSIRKVRFWPRKSKATAVLHALLTAAGARGRDLHIPNRKAKLPRSVTVGVKVGRRRDTNGKKDGKGKDNRPTVQRMNVGRGDTYWGKATPIAESLHCDLFPNGSGEFVCSPPPSKPIARLDMEQLVAPVRENPGGDNAGEEQPNTWVILGADPKGPKKRVKAEVGLPAKHPLSAHGQAWNGEPYEVTEIVENRHLRREKDARKLGIRKRDRAADDVTSYEVEAVPCLMWLRPGAAVTAPLATRRIKARARSWTLPLSPTPDPLVIGGTRRSNW